MNREHESTLPASLQAHVNALSSAAPDSHAIEGAQIRLERSLREPGARRAPDKPRRARWVAFAATACAALALILVPFVVSDRGGLAFAEVQRHFENFRTLSMSIEQGGVAGTVVPHINVVLDDAGNVRTDVGQELSVVVNAVEGRVLMLMHDGKSAMRFPIDAVPMEPASEALSWLDELREFKGLATPIAETRVIDGEIAQGWSLDIGGARIELWARSDGMPLTMSIGQGRRTGSSGEGVGYINMMDLRMNFDFDAPIDPAALSTEIPAGYTSAFAG
jgi:hypothetical protein